MKLNKKLVLLLAALLLVFTLSSCGVAPQKELTITEEETAQGYVLYKEFGVKYKMPEVFKTYPQNISAYELGEPENDENPLYKQVIFEFFSDELIQKYTEIVSSQMTQEEMLKAMTEEVLDKTNKLYSFSLVKKDLLPKDDKALQELTGFTNNEKIGESENIVQYYSTNEENTEGLSETSLKAYQDLSAGIKGIRETFEIGKPIISKDDLASVKNLTFSSTDLDGNKVDSSIFKDSKITMINIWATWCAPCREEMPDIAQLGKDYKDKGVNVLGIVTDIVPDSPEGEEQAIEVAKQIINESSVEYTNIKPNEELENSVLKFVTGVPTTIFVDSNGNVIGEPVIGSRSKDEFAAIIDELLAK